MQDVIQVPGFEHVHVRLVRSKCARQMSLRVSRLDGRVRLTVPLRCPEREAVRFVADRAGWIAQHVTNAVTEQPVTLGTALPIYGKLHSITAGQGRKIIIEDGHIFVPGAADQIPARIKSHLRQMARLALVRATDDYAKALGVSVGRVAIKDTRSRWGSCSSAGNINYSWRLIMAPPEVLNYVAAHEVCHRLEMNHSAAFWAHVKRLYPNHKTAQEWLKSEGPNLHSFRFEVS
ncbi:MAG: M48 family metallopeptidase [Planktomarina sp.]